MRKDDEIRLLHMLDAAREAVGFSRGRTRGDLDNDRQLVLCAGQGCRDRRRGGNVGHRAHTSTFAGDTVGADRSNILCLCVPREVDPGILTDLRHVGIDERPTGRFGIDRREVGFG